MLGWCQKKVLSWMTWQKGMKVGNEGSGKWHVGNMGYLLTMGRGCRKEMSLGLDSSFARARGEKLQGERREGENWAQAHPSI